MLDTTVMIMVVPYFDTLLFLTLLMEVIVAGWKNMEEQALNPYFEVGVKVSLLICIPL